LVSRIEAAWLLSTIIGILVLIALPLMLAVAMIIYADRKIWAAMALRRGPNVVGPFGLLQSFADGLKVFLQETIIPSAANKGLFLIAPIITFTVALMAWAVVPFGAGVVLADINVGLLYILAISSLGVYGVVIAGWASNSKYPFFSAMRASAFFKPKATINYPFEKGPLSPALPRRACAAPLSRTARSAASPASCARRSARRRRSPSRPSRAQRRHRAAPRATTST
jgi:hypothetical protein